MAINTHNKLPCNNSKFENFQKKIVNIFCFWSSVTCNIQVLFLLKFFPFKFFNVPLNKILGATKFIKLYFHPKRKCWDRAVRISLPFLSSARLLEERKEFDGAVCSIGLICLRQQPHHVKGFANQNFQNWSNVHHIYEVKFPSAPHLMNLVFTSHCFKW